MGNHDSSLRSTQHFGSLESDGICPCLFFAESEVLNHVGRIAGQAQQTGESLTLHNPRWPILCVGPALLPVISSYWEEDALGTRRAFPKLARLGIATWPATRSGNARSCAGQPLRRGKVETTCVRCQEALGVHPQTRYARGTHGIFKRGGTCALRQIVSSPSQHRHQQHFDRPLPAVSGDPSRSEQFFESEWTKTVILAGKAGIPGRTKMPSVMPGTT